ncbi:MAG: hypothetical protein WC651_00945 [Candidatus Gracilibacteria bacterium]|jgi:cell division protein FtsB
MKLKVLFILPLVVFSALWWVPLAVADDVAPAGGGNLEYDSEAKKQQAKELQDELAVIEEELNKLKSELAGFESGLANAEAEKAKGVDQNQDIEINLKENELKLAMDQESKACAYDDDGKVCQKAKENFLSALEAFNQAKDPAKAVADKISKLQSQIAETKGKITQKQAEFDAKQKQIEELIGGVLNPTGANDQGISNYQGGGTVLPDTKYQEMSDCETIMRYVNIHPSKVEEYVAGRNGKITEIKIKNVNPSYTDILGCAIKTGDVKLWMVPYFVRYILEFIIGISGLASVGGIIYGGYLYLFAGLSDDQQKGKSAIKNSLIALVLSLSAWAIVNIVISLVTSI